MKIISTIAKILNPKSFEMTDAIQKAPFKRKGVVSFDEFYNTYKISIDELLEAVEICLKHRKTGFLINSKLVRPDLLEKFGENKADIMIERLSEYQRSFHSFYLLDTTGISVAEEVRLAKQDFLISYPEVPDEFLSQLNNDFCMARK